MVSHAVQVLTISQKRPSFAMADRHKITPAHTESAASKPRWLECCAGIFFGVLSILCAILGIIALAMARSQDRTRMCFSLALAADDVAHSICCRGSPLA